MIEDGWLPGALHTLYLMVRLPVGTSWWPGYNWVAEAVEGSWVPVPAHWVGSELRACLSCLTEMVRVAMGGGG